MTPTAPKPSVRVIEELRAHLKASDEAQLQLHAHILDPKKPRPSYDEWWGPEDIQRAASAALEHLPALLAVVEAATCIRHWHDSGPNNEGMVVSSEHVRKLWEALSALDATGGGHG